MIDALPHFGFSSICNVLAAIKTAKLLGLGADDAIITVATDGGAMYSSERAKTLARRYRGEYSHTDAAEAFGQHLAHVSTEHMIDMTEADRRRVFNLGYYTWVEQQGTPFELFEQRRHQDFWRGLRRYVGVWDEMIDDFNDARRGMSHESGIRPLRAVTHGLRTMTGRDPHDEHRVATTLELLFDLAFVIAFSVAGSEFAHLIAEGHYRAGLAGFSFAMFAVVWAWINFTWFASAYDTDDWIYRVTTMVQMIGVVIMSLGLPAMFASIDHDDRLDNRAMVFGYIVMRVPMIAQWASAARQDPPPAASVARYIGAIVRVTDRLDADVADRRASDRRADAGGAAGRAANWSARTSPNASTAARRGIRTTSPSATGCWRSSPSARCCSAPSPRSVP